MFVGAGNGCALDAAGLIGYCRPAICRMAAPSGVCIRPAVRVVCRCSQAVSYLIDIMVISYQGIVNRICCFHKRCVKFWKELLRKRERISCKEGEGSHGFEKK